MNVRDIKMPCSKCGSKNTTVSCYPPDTNPLNKLLNFISDTLNTRFRGGAVFVTCKDCGHVSLVQIL